MSEMNHSSFVTSPQTAAAASLLALNQGPFLNCRESPGTSAVNNSLFAGYPFNTKEELVDSKTDTGPQVDLYAMADENGVPGQGVVSINPFPEGAEQTSPITPVTNSAPQILPYRPSASSGDAMLSAINYNENEILQDGAFDVSVAGTLPNLDDGLLSNMGTHDLFDGEGNVNDSYEMEGLSPHSFNDPGSGLVDGSLSSVMDSDSLGSLDQARTPDSSKQKKKMKSQKLSPGGGVSQGSPGRPGIATCPTCNKSFNNSSALAKHRLTHSDERKYVCNLCQKAFKRQDHLNGHLMTHRDKKPYECTVENCQKSYCDARSLRRHLENHHNQTPEQIQSAIAKVASNAAAVIAAAAASNNASIKASNPSSATSPSSTQGQQQPGTQGTGTVPTAQPLNSEGQQKFGQSVVSHQSNPHSPRVEEPSPGYSPISPVPTQNLGVIPSVSPAHVRLHSTSNTTEKSGEDKTVICTICDRSFKNVQALNGHMRLHGGYFKKTNLHDVKEEKKSKKMPTIREMVPPQPVIHQPAITSNNQSFLSTTDQVESSQQSRLNEGLYGGQSLPIISSVPPESPQGEAVHQEKIQLHHAQQQEQQQKQLQLQLQREQQLQEQQAQLQQQHKQQQLQQQQEQKIQQEQQIQSQIQQQLHQLQLEQLALEQHLQAQRQQQHEQQQHVLVKQEQPQIQYLQQQPGSQANSMPPSPQVPQSPHLQRQSSIESTMYDYQHSNPHPNQQTQQYHPSIQQENSQDHNHPQFTSPIPSSMAIQLQQLAQRQELQRQEQELAQRQEQEIIQRQEQELAQRQEIQRQEQEILKRQEQELAQRQEIQRQEQELIQRQLLLKQEQEIVQRQEQLILTSRQELPLLQNQVHQPEQGQGHIVGSSNPGHNVLQSSVHLPTTTSVTMNTYQHLTSPPPTNLTSVSVHSTIPSAFAQAQISNFALQNPTLKNEIQTIPVSAIAVQRLIDPSIITASPVTIVSTTSSQEMTVSQLLNTLESPANFTSLQNFLPVNTKPSATQSANTINKPEVVNVGNQQMESTVAYASDKTSESSSVFHSIGSKSQDFDLDSRLDDINDIYKKELSSAATTENPFTFPPIDVDMTEHVNNDDGAVQNGNSGVSKTIQSRHKELKRRLSLGNEIQTAPILNMSVSPPKTCATTLTKHTLSNSAFSDNRQRIRSKSGDDFKYFRSKSEEYSFMRPRSRTEVSPMKSKSVEKFTWERSTSYLLSRSDGAQHSLGQFRNPNMLTGQPKIRRKHRPAPLFIPPHRGFSGFQSNLRSPRVPPNMEGRGHTPPPYTPPPMLSPNRSGSGLFCSISGVWKPALTPKSAPITPRSSLLLSSRSNSVIDDSAIEPVKPEVASEAPPETDVLPHVNIGSQYQAEIPTCNGSISEALRAESREDLLWDPANVADLSDEDVQYYQDLACSSAVNGNGFNVEYALHILNIYKGNIQTAMLRLMSGKVSLPKDHTLLSYTYQETDSWSTEEIERYQQALWKCDKDFYALSKEMGTKSVKECVQFYYLWKKVCPDEHKRLRLIRRRREQERLYNLRSTQQQQQTTQATSQQPPVQAAAPQSEAVTNYEEFDEMESESGASTEVEEQNDNEMEDKMSDDKMSTASSVSASPTPTYTCSYPDCNATFNSKQGLNGHVRIHKGASGNRGTVQAKTLPSGEITGPGRPASKPTSFANRSPMYDDFGNEIFPCRLCGRVFTKVKSRSAHMKSHRIIDNDKNKNKAAAAAAAASVAQNNFEISVNKFQGSPHR
ncbi:hypothetical protein FSP39_022050 [Pinctada imbricata]|uniref:Transcriptional-regulating factor 1 n=1 Tax=Pinctada imbricata TaxID=66713 RepID=A0AA89BTI9_PINIB|nr:hypothetical protein FSP39_022050 [Pinctada imbricata]